MTAVLIYLWNALKKGVSYCFGSCCGSGEADTAAKNVAVNTTTSVNNTCVCCSHVEMNRMLKKSTHAGPEGQSTVTANQTPIIKPEEFGDMNLKLLQTSDESFHTAVEELSPLLSPEDTVVVPCPLEMSGNFDFSFTNPSLFMLLTLSLVLLLLTFILKKEDQD